MKPRNRRVICSPHKLEGGLCQRWQQNLENSCCFLFVQMIANRAGQEYVHDSEKTRKQAKDDLTNLLSPVEDESDDSDDHVDGNA